MPDTKPIPPHLVLDYVAALLRLLCVKQGVADSDLPASPVAPAEEPPPESDSDLDELRRILDSNPALRQAIKTGDI